MQTPRRRTTAAGALALVLSQAPLLLVPAAHAQLPQSEELLPPDRLDRHAHENEPSASGLWLAATGQARVHAEGHAFGAGIILGTAVDVWAAPPIAAPAGAPPAETSHEPPLRVDAALARGAVRAALARAGGAEAEQRLGSLAARSRSSATLPELRLRVMRVVDEDESLAPTAYDPSRVTASGGASTWLEARATWKLDRLVFAREEIAVERLRMGRERALRALEHAVLDALARWHRARFRALDPEAPFERRVEADLEAAALEASLDVWTDGWLSRELARRSSRQRR